MRLGDGSRDAVNKSSITWACSDRKLQSKVAEEVRNLKNIKTDLLAREAALKAMTFDDDKKNLYTEVLRLVDRRLGEINDDPKSSQGDTTSQGPSEMKKLLLESPSWRDQSRLSLLIAAGAKEGSNLAQLRPDTPCCYPSREYYAFIEGTHIEILFGATFETVLKILESNSTDKPF